MSARFAGAFVDTAALDGKPLAAMSPAAPVDAINLLRFMSVPL